MPRASRGLRHPFAECNRMHGWYVGVWLNYLPLHSALSTYFHGMMPRQRSSSHFSSNYTIHIVYRVAHVSKETSEIETPCNLQAVGRHKKEDHIFKSLVMREISCDATDNLVRIYRCDKNVSLRYGDWWCIVKHIAYFSLFIISFT